MDDSRYVFPAETRLLVSLAPPVPDDDSVKRVAARARTLITPTRTYRRFAAVGAIAVVAAAAVGIGLLARSAPVRQPVPVSQPVARPAYPMDNVPFVPRHLFTKDNFGRLTAADLEKRYSIRLAFPASAATGTYEGIFESGYDDPPNYYAVYSNDIMISLRIEPTAEGAERQVQNEVRGDIGLYATKINLNGVEAFAVPRLNVPPQTDWTSGESAPGSGATVYKTVPGTGIATATAKVFWRSGRIFVRVMNPDASVDTLVAVARGLMLEADAAAE